ncbi:MAG: tetratricopeptide repeat protein, partial [Calditrichaeota bacterium]|nr:tetratricopeptide repeat protein [Calditrichota bacterium]
TMYSRLDSLYEAALAIYPTNALLLNNYSYSLGERGVHLERALEMARRALERDPQNGAYLDTIGWIYYKLGNYPRALEYLQQAAAQMDGNPEVNEHLGDVYFQLQQRDKARYYWQQALEQSPDNETLKIKLQQ